MYSITLDKIVEEFNLEVITNHDRVKDILVSSPILNRPGLPLAGYMKHFDSGKIQILGKVEAGYLNDMTPEKRMEKLDSFFSYRFPCMIVTRGLDVFEEAIVKSCQYKIPILKSNDVTSRFASSLLAYLNTQLAPRITKPGCFVEVHGEGVLIFGESGVGKSETVLELVKRGHRLVADDVVEIRKVSDQVLVGTAPDIIRHFIEIRGIGVLDAKMLYGVGSVKMSETINLVINLEFWNEKKTYDRLGLVEKRIDILGVKVPYLNTPVHPGRNLAIIIEVAAMNNRQKKMGYNAAKVLTQHIDEQVE